MTPYTPASTASRTVTPLDTCDTPSDPHVKPPSGHSPRTQSIRVHRAAAPAAVSTGCSCRRTSGYPRPKSATDSAASSVSANHPSVPNNRSHDSEMPNAVSP